MSSLGIIRFHLPFMTFFRGGRLDTTKNFRVKLPSLKQSNSGHGSPITAHFGASSPATSACSCAATQMATSAVISGSVTSTAFPCLDMPFSTKRSIPSISIAFPSGELFPDRAASFDVERWHPGLGKIKIRHSRTREPSGLIQIDFPSFLFQGQVMKTKPAIHPFPIQTGQVDSAHLNSLKRLRQSPPCPPTYS